MPAMTVARPTYYPPHVRAQTSGPTRFFMHLGNVIQQARLPPMTYTSVSTGPKHAEVWTVSVTICVPTYDPYRRHMVDVHGHPLYQPLMYVATGSTKQKAKDAAAHQALVDGLGIDISTLCD
ncbi:hypothetical protein FRC03_003847 [Tulasnella sp. 419]|nr:hypothetical protein FRC03_003847 [Tulasnella sp. 419]